MSDSAGVRRVINFSPAWEPQDRWSIDEDPVLRLGTVSGPAEEQFFRIRGATRLSDGRVAILDGGSSQLRFFGPDGEHLYSVGQAGDGPGEFRGPQYLQRLEGDILQVTDGWSRIRFGPDGALISHERLDVDRALTLGGFRSEGCTIPSPMFVDDDVILCEGSSDVRLMPEEPGPWTLQDLVVRAPWSLEQADTIGRFVRREAWVLPWNGLRFYAEPPLSMAGLFALGERAGLFVYGTSSRYRFHVYELESTSLVMIVEGAPPTRVPTPDEVEEGWEEATRALVRDVEIRDRLPVPDLISDATRVYVDDLGSLWARRRWSEPDQVPYDVFSSDGIWLGEVTMPYDIEVFEIGVDYVLGLVRDELAVEYVLWYYLSRN